MRFLSFCAALIFAATPVSADKFKVVTTFTIIADMAKNVAGDLADVVSITKPGAEIHGFQPTPQDIVAAQGGDLILWNGLGLELWFERFFASLKNVPSVVISQGVEPISIGKGPYTGKANPHAWMSPTAGQLYVDNIAAALAKYDPDNATEYLANADAYKARIAAEIGPIAKMLADLPENKRWLVTSEGAFSYLARDFNLQEVYLWPTNADQQGSPRQVKAVIDIMRAQNIGVIFSESTVSAAPAKQVARETGAAYGGMLYADSLSKPDGPVPSYIELLRVTSTIISQGLSK